MSSLPRKFFCPTLCRRYKVLRNVCIIHHYTFKQRHISKCVNIRSTAARFSYLAWVVQCSLVLAYLLRSHRVLGFTVRISTVYFKLSTMEGHNCNYSKVVDDMNRPTQGRNAGTLRIVLNYEPGLFPYLSRRIRRRCKTLIQRIPFFFPAGPISF